MDLPDDVVQYFARMPRVIPPLIRENAILCCDETAKMERGEREKLSPAELLLFGDTACGLAAMVAISVGDAFTARKVRYTTNLPWEIAASLLRKGWKPGDQLMSHVVGKDQAS